MLYGRLLDNNSHGCESLVDISYPILHGRDEPDWRQADALRLFHTLFTLSSMFSLKHPGA